MISRITSRFVLLFNPHSALPQIIHWLRLVSNLCLTTLALKTLDAQRLLRYHSVALFKYCGVLFVYFPKAVYRIHRWHMRHKSIRKHKERSFTVGKKKGFQDSLLSCTSNEWCWSHYITSRIDTVYGNIDTKCWSSMSIVWLVSFSVDWNTDWAVIILLLLSNKHVSILSCRSNLIH